MIINEIMSNALQHAFPPSFKGKGTIEITVHWVNEDEVELIVEDNGVGIPDNLDDHDANSLGFQLVRLLAEDQMNGKLKIESGEGTRISVRMKLGDMNEKKNNSHLGKLK